MRSGLAMPILIWSNVSGLATGFAKLVISFIFGPFQGKSLGEAGEGGGALPPAPSLSRQLLLFLVILIDDRIQLDVEAERPHLLDEHVEALRNAGLERVVALDDRLVDLGAADHVVRLHGQHFL